MILIKVTFISENATLCFFTHSKIILVQTDIEPYMITEFDKSKQPSCKTISAKLPKKEFNKINDFVSDGFFLNEEDFVRQSIREKLKNMEAITLRDIPYEQQKEEIIDYAEKHKVVDALEIADELLLDVFDVNDIMAELIEEGILEEL